MGVDSIAGSNPALSVIEFDPRRRRAVGPLYRGRDDLRDSEVTVSISASTPAPERRARPDRRSLAGVGIGVTLMCIAFAALGLDGSSVDWLVKEDGLVEWIGAIGLLVGAVLFLLAFLHVRRHPTAALAPVGVWALLVVAVALLFFCGEEISWGQRILGFGTPETIGGVNAQDETTFHNVNFLQGGLTDGDRLFRAAWLGFFVLLPLCCWLWPRVRARLDPLLPIVPASLAVLFFASWMIALIALNVFDTASYISEYPISHATSEIQEGCVEVLMAIAGLLTLQRVRARAGARVAVLRPAS